jgi:hypothetical protein
VGQGKAPGRARGPHAGWPAPGPPVAPPFFVFFFLLRARRTSTQSTGKGGHGETRTGRFLAVKCLRKPRGSGGPLARRWVGEGEWSALRGSDAMTAQSLFGRVRDDDDWAWRIGGYADGRLRKSPSRTPCGSPFLLPCQLDLASGIAEQSQTNKIGSRLVGHDVQSGPRRRPHPMSYHRAETSS